jgi:hypothetical protein
MILGRMSDVLRLYVNFGLHKNGSGCVGLKTPPIHEVLILTNLGATSSREPWGAGGTARPGHRVAVNSP